MKRIPESTWAEIRMARASGIGLREIARNMGIPEGTVLARAKREGWTQQIQFAKTLAKRAAHGALFKQTELSNRGSVQLLAVKLVGAELLRKFS
jgi:hypothetical protein